MERLPIYLNCFFFETESGKVVHTYKIEASNITPHPFQLFKLNKDVADEWENLSVYASVEDAVMILLKELFSRDLEDEIIHGQASMNPAEIMKKINDGDRSVSIYGSTNNETFRLEFDVDFQQLVERASVT
jgi:hypothetical protein